MAARVGCICSVPIRESRPKSYTVNEATEARVEILGKGNQFFAIGIHPDSGEPLRWSDSPENIHRDDLPALTDEQTQAIIEFARDLIGATRKVYRSADEPLPVRTLTGTEWPIGDICSALDTTPCPSDYNSWFRISSAVFSACNGGGDGYSAWRLWCSVGPNYDKAKVDALWRSLFNSPAYYTAGTLAVEARSHDPHWDRPSLVTPLDDFYGRTLHGT